MAHNVLIACATEKEISKFLSTAIIHSQSFLSVTEIPVFHGSIGSECFKIILTGIGAVNTAHALTIAIEHFHPDIMIQTGIAGCFKESGLNIGDIAVATLERYLHSGVQSPGEFPAPLPFPLVDNNAATTKGIFPVDPELCMNAYNILSKETKNEGYHVEKGSFLTVSTITAASQTARDLYLAFSPVMESMEGSAAAHIALRYHIPLLEIRAASNFVGDRNKNNWNIPLSMERINKALTICMKMKVFNGI